MKGKRTLPAPLSSLNIYLEILLNPKVFQFVLHQGYCEFNGIDNLIIFVIFALEQMFMVKCEPCIIRKENHCFLGIQLFILLNVNNN